MQKKPNLKYRYFVAVAPLVTILVGVFLAGVLKIEPEDQFISWGVALAASILWLSGTLIFTSKSPRTQ